MLIVHLLHLGEQILKQRDHKPEILLIQLLVGQQSAQQRLQTDRVVLLDDHEGAPQFVDLVHALAERGPVRANTHITVH